MIKGKDIKDREKMGLGEEGREKLTRVGNIKICTQSLVRCSTKHWLYFYGLMLSLDLICVFYPHKVFIFLSLS